MAFCSGCGSKIELNHKFCKQCGVKDKQQPSAKQTLTLSEFSKTRENKRKQALSTKNEKAAKPRTTGTAYHQQQSQPKSWYS